MLKVLHPSAFICVLKLLLLPYLLIQMSIGHVFLDTQCFTTGYLIYLASILISWCSKKQPPVSCSSIESEYRSIAHVCVEATWICFLVRELGARLSIPILIHCDNLNSTILLLTKFIMLTRDKSNFIVTLFMKKLSFVVIVFVIFSLLIKRLIFSPRLFINLVMASFSPNLSD